MKTLLKLLLLIGVLAYMVYAFVGMTGGEDKTRCTQVNVVIADSTHAGFITADEVKRIIDKAGLNPLGREMEQVNGEAIEQALRRNSFVRLVKCYKTPGGRVNINVAQRLPVLRVKADNGEDYYIDASGEAMMPEGYTADVAVATGRITKAYAKTRLACLARHLRDDAFAGDLIEQIAVGADQRVTLIPRIGCEAIDIGRIDTLGFGFQMQSLRAFYTKVLPAVGWNAYRKVSLEYAGQIVCKKS